MQQKQESIPNLILSCIPYAKLKKESIECWINCAEEFQISYNPLNKIHFIWRLFVPKLRRPRHPWAQVSSKPYGGRKHPDIESIFFKSKTIHDNTQHLSQVTACNIHIILFSRWTITLKITTKNLFYAFYVRTNTAPLFFLCHGWC